MRPPLLLFLASSPLWSGCSGLTEPISEETAGKTKAVAVAPARLETARPNTEPARKKAVPQNVVAQAKSRRVVGQAADDQLTVSHILISYSGAARSQATRSKDEARQIASKLREQLRQGEDFGELALAHSDDPTAKANRGNLRSAPATAWVKPFADAAFALRPGETSELVETPFGIHIIKRDK